jgi:hypothetical protein
MADGVTPNTGWVTAPMRLSEQSKMTRAEVRMLERIKRTVAGTQTVSGAEKLLDVWRARRAATRADHTRFDPVAAYRFELSQGHQPAGIKLDLYRKNLMAAREASRITHDRRKAAALKEIDIKLASIDNDLAQSAKEREWTLSLVEPERARAEEEYLRWREIMGRPAFADKLDTPFGKALEEREQAPADDAASEASPAVGPQTFLAAFARAIGAAITQSIREVRNFLRDRYHWLFVGPEIWFSQPAMEVLLRGRADVAIAAAAVYTLALAALGATGGIFLKRSKETRLVQDGEGQWRKETRVRPMQLAYATSALMFGVIMAYGGAQLRSVLPEIDAVNDRIVQLQADRTTAIAAGTPLSESIATELDNLRQERLHIMERSINVFERRDSLLAFFFYLALFAIFAYKQIIRFDPDFSYAIVAEQHLRARKFTIEIESELKFREKELEARRTELVAQRTHLNAVEVAVEEYDQAIARAEEDIRVFQALSDEIIRSRVARFARNYLRAAKDIPETMPEDMRARFRDAAQGGSTNAKPA